MGKRIEEGERDWRERESGGKGTEITNLFRGALNANAKKPTAANGMISDMADGKRPKVVFN